MALEVNVFNLDDSYVIEIEGILDISTRYIFDTEFEKIENIKSLTIDFSKLEFIDSTGIGAIMDLIFLAQEQGFSLSLTGIKEDVRNTFEIIGLFQILESIQGEAG